MDYDTVKAMMENGNGQAFVAYIQANIDALRDESIDSSLPADEYKTVSLGRDKALAHLKHMMTPFMQYKDVEVKKRIKSNSLYYTHAPK